MQPGAPGPDPQQPPQNPYEQPAHGGAGAMGQPQGQNNTLGLVSMILGIASIPLVCCFYLGLPVGIAALVTGYLGKQKADQGLATNRGQAMAGLICGGIAVALEILLIVLVVVLNVVDVPTY